MNEENLSMPRCDIVRLQNEIKQLKELLKLCKESIENYRYGENHNFTADNIVRMIDNVIGEKK